MDESINKTIDKTGFNSQHHHIYELFTIYGNLLTLFMIHESDKD